MSREDNRARGSAASGVTQHSGPRLLVRFGRSWEYAILERARQHRADRLRLFLDRLAQGRRGIAPTLRFTMVFLPFALCYFLSYVFRTINGPLADALIRRFALDAGSLGIITSAYFLAFALSAIPIGVALDVYGPRLVQAWLMTVAAIGASVFALASSPFLLVLGRFLIGVGVAGGLMAGLKAHALWVAPSRLPLANGVLVMFGGLGATATTLPIASTEQILGWRGTFLVLALASFLLALTVFALVPRGATAGGAFGSPGRASTTKGFIDAISDRRFQRLAPLSASVVGTAFAIHGLWAARWFADVEGLSSTEILANLFAMGLGLTFGAVLIGLADVWLSRFGLDQARIFGGFCLVFMGIEGLLLTHVRMPVWLPWSLVGGFGGLCVLSYSILDSMFPPTLVGRANSALNVCHLAAAWVVQAVMGLVLAYWAANPSGHYPLVAYRVAFMLPLGLQIIAFVWFVVSAWSDSRRADLAGSLSPAIDSAASN